MLKANAVLDRDFLEMRHRVIDLAAGLDRLDRAEGRASLQQDKRLAMLHDAIRVLIDGRPERAERVQLAFSVPHGDN